MMKSRLIAVATTGTLVAGLSIGAVSLAGPALADNYAPSQPITSTVSGETVSTAAAAVSQTLQSVATQASASGNNAKTTSVVSAVNSALKQSLGKTPTRPSPSSAKAKQVPKRTAKQATRK